LLEFSSPSRRIFIGSHSLPPSLVRRIGPSAGSQQHKVGSHGGRRPQVERPECWLEPSPRACRGGGTQTLTPKSHDPCIGFSQAPEHAEGEGLLHDKGEGRTQDTADDCLS
jgi:hypothetical protein